MTETPAPARLAEPSSDAIDAALLVLDGTNGPSSFPGFTHTEDVWLVRDALRAAYAIDGGAPRATTGETMDWDDLLKFLDSCADGYNTDTGDTDGGRPGHLARALRAALRAADGGTP